MVLVSKKFSTIRLYNQAIRSSLFSIYICKQTGTVCSGGTGNKVVAQL